MPKLTIKFSDDARREGRAAVRLIHVADVDGKHLDEHRANDFRLGHDGLVVDVSPGYYAIQAYWRTGAASYTSTLVNGAAPCSVELEPYNSSWPKELGPSNEVSVGRLARQMSLPRSDEWSFLLDRGPAIGDSSFLVTKDLHGDVPTLPRNGIERREWIAYRNDGRPVLASAPLCPPPYGAGDKVLLRASHRALPRLAFSDEQSDISVMCDMLCGSSSHTEMVYLATFEKSAIDRLLETDPIHYVAFALANTHAARAELATLPVSSHEEWLPDLLILRAYHHLYTGRDDLACRLFKQSVKVGIPYFGRSVKYLSEGCSLLKHMYPDLEETNRLAWNLAIRTEPTEVFTTVRLDMPMRFAVEGH